MFIFYYELLLFSVRTYFRYCSFKLFVTYKQKNTCICMNLMSVFVVAILTFQFCHPGNCFCKRKIRPSCLSICNLEVNKKAIWLFILTLELSKISMLTFLSSFNQFSFDIKELDSTNFLTSRQKIRKSVLGWKDKTKRIENTRPTIQLLSGETNIKTTTIIAIIIIIIFT